MKKIVPYILIIVVFAGFIFLKHRDLVTYRFDGNIVDNYLRSQDIEDRDDVIKDRIFISDSDIYLASGYLYAKGESPIKYNFQHPPFVKYMFGFSTLLTENPYWIQIFLGSVFLVLTYTLSLQVTKNRWISLLPALLVMIDPLFGSVLSGGYLDLGQAVFGILFAVLAIYYPEKWLLSGISLGLFAASKFWSTTVVFAGLIYAFKLVRKEKIDVVKLLFSFATAFLVFTSTYARVFIDSGFSFNILAFLAKDLKFMLSHNSSAGFGGSVFLFVSGFFSPWWKAGTERAAEWSIFWPAGLVCSIILAIKSKLKSAESFFYLLPFVYLLSISTGVPFARYFVIILPFIYVSLVKLLFESFYRKK